MPTSSPPANFSLLEETGAFLEHIGPIYRRGVGEEVSFALQVDERHLNLGGVAHGGLLATLVDFSLGRAIAAAGEDATPAATVSLTTDFLGPAETGDWLIAHTQVERIGNRLAFADCSLTVEGREVVRGRAVFAVLS